MKALSMNNDPNMLPDNKQQSSSPTSVDEQITANGSKESSPPSSQPLLLQTLPGLGNWNYYFIVKLILFFKDIIGFSVLANLAFAAYLLLPTQSNQWQRLKQWFAFPLAIALFYYDSWLPPIIRLIDEINNIKGFSFGYLVELTNRFINLELITGAFILWVAFIYLKQWFRISVFTITVMVLMASGVWQEKPDMPKQEAPVWVNQSDERSNFLDAALPPEQALSQFFQQELRRKVSFPAALNYQPDYDILILNICSLSWSDLEYTGLKNHPLFSEFDIIFNQFNSAASYSGPAAIRLLRASCGQLPHSELYQAGDNDCYLFQNLANLGFGQQMVLNHTGQFDNFIDLIKQEGRLNATPMARDRIPVAQRSFDGSPISGDYPTLMRWLENRTNETDKPIAAYYNSISLHDGNRFVGKQAHLDSLENFHPRTSQLLEDLLQFFKAVEDSGRNLIIVMVPEHGAAVQGDKLQIAGLRDIPSHSITHVPVGFKIIGEHFQKPEKTLIMNRPSNYMAVSYVLNQLVQQNPFSQENNVDLTNIMNNVPATGFVAENKGTTMINQKDTFLMRYKQGEWMNYPTD